MEVNALMKPSDASDNSRYEVNSLRQELKLRILLQNLLLIMLVFVFTIVAGVAALSPRSAWPLAAVYNTSVLAAVLQWCHHGV